MTFSLDGWKTYSIWDHSARVSDLYEKRCRRLVEEMTSHTQAALLLRPFATEGDHLLDVGCGSGYFYHALRTHHVPVEYYGIDASRTLIDIGRRWMPEHRLPAERLLHGRIEDLDGDVDHIVCINVLSNVDNYHRPLERMLRMARKTLILRESLAGAAKYSYVKDEFLDEGIDLRVYVNTYDQHELLEFIRAHGCNARVITDEYTGGNPQQVIGHDHHWTFVLVEKLVEPSRDVGVNT